MNRSKMLTREELYYLKLLVHNYSYEQMEEFLEIEKEDILKIENEIHRKLKTNNSCEAIIKAYNKKILNAYDFVNNVIKAEASLYSYIIFDKYFAKKRTIPKDMMTIKDDLLYLLKLCHQRIKEENKKNGVTTSSLNQLEKEYLKIKYRDFKRKINSKIFPFSKKHVEKMDITILKKLQVNCWYNAYRKAFELQLLKRLDYKSKTIQLKLLKFEKKILESQKFELMKEKLQVDIIYRELIAFYNTIEYNRFHKVA